MASAGGLEGWVSVCILVIFVPMYKDTFIQANVFYWRNGEYLYFCTKGFKNGKGKNESV